MSKSIGDKCTICVNSIREDDNVNTKCGHKFHYNCLNEWTYSCTRNKLMIPIIMEPHMLDPKQWPAGIVPLYLGSTLYVDASYDRLINNCILLLTKMLITYKIFPSRFPYIKRKMLPIKERIRRSKNRDKNIVTQVRI